MDVERHLITLIYMSMRMLRFSVKIVYAMGMERRCLLALENVTEAWWMCKAEDAISVNRNS
jgi:hypothetical protein